MSKQNYSRRIAGKNREKGKTGITNITKNAEKKEKSQ